MTLDLLALLLSLLAIALLAASSLMDFRKLWITLLSYFSGFMSWVMYWLSKGHPDRSYLFFITGFLIFIHLSLKLQLKKMNKK
jgi:hypothetical protein